ncbi:hypothetical protein OWV82_026566, partial [Melia azedarach]
IRARATRAPAARLPTSSRDPRVPRGTCRRPSPRGGRAARAALKLNSHRAAGRILCRRLKYATGYCRPRWGEGSPAPARVRAAPGRVPRMEVSRGAPRALHAACRASSPLSRPARTPPALPAPRPHVPARALQGLAAPLPCAWPQGLPAGASLFARACAQGCSTPTEVSRGLSSPHARVPAATYPGHCPPLRPMHSRNACRPAGIALCARHLGQLVNLCCRARACSANGGLAAGQPRATARCLPRERALSRPRAHPRPCPPPCASASSPRIGRGSPLAEEGSTCAWPQGLPAGLAFCRGLPPSVSLLVLPSLHPKGAVHGLASGSKKLLKPYIGGQCSSPLGCLSGMAMGRPPWGPPSLAGAPAHTCSVLVHRTVDAPSASVIPQAPLWPCGCVRYPVLLTRAREFEGFVAPIRLAPSRARGGLEACSVFLACPAILRTAASAHGASPVLSDAERYAWARGRLGLAVPKLRAFVLDANDCRARLDLAQRVVRASASPRNATWLILPVVICLSQRLSHACVSMN